MPALWVDGYDTGYARLGADINDRFPADSPYQQVGSSRGGAARPPVRYTWMKLSYLIAIVLAMAGWLFLIVWVVSRLF